MSAFQKFLDTWTQIFMKIGYARVSTIEQNLDLQIDALKKAGCEKIFSDTASGARVDRKGLEDILEFCRAGDSLVVWKLDRLGRSLKHLINTVNFLIQKEVGFVSLQENIDTTTSSGKFFFHVFGALAEFERDIIRDRTQAGLQAARSRGRQGGRPKKLSQRKIAMAKQMMKDESMTIKEICEEMDISKTTLYRYCEPRIGARSEKKE
jgi:DNA invertase Pin-like site-specific DNA recombinase